MRILVTGCTALQVDTPHRTIQKIDVPGYLVEEFRHQGHSVEWRKVLLGEDTNTWEYDMLVVCIAPPHSLNARHSLGAFWSLRWKGPTYVFWDDWQTREVVNGTRTCARRGLAQYEKLLVNQNNEPFYREDRAKIVQHHEELTELFRSFEEIWPLNRTHLLPCFAWGDRSKVVKLLPKSNWDPVEINPSSKVPLVERPRLLELWEKRDRTWLMASLMPHGDWVDKQKLTWNIAYVGSRKMMRERGGDRYNTELEVQEAYAAHWGALAPKYYHAGSGWFRSRFIYAANARSIMLCSPHEGSAIGGPYMLNNVIELEQFSDRTLLELADFQAMTWANRNMGTSFEDQVAWLVKIAS